MKTVCKRKLCNNRQIFRLIVRMAVSACLVLPVAVRAEKSSPPPGPKHDSEVLVEVGGTTITAGDLKKTLASSPFGVQFNTMNDNAQAALRGVILKRLVTSRLLYLEAKKRKLAENPAIKKDLERFRKSLLYRRFMDRLRRNALPDPATVDRLKRRYKDNPDALAAARAAARARKYRALRVLTIQNLRDRFKVRTFEERIKPGMTPDTILLQGRNIGITYGDLIRGYNLATPPDADWIKERLYQQAEVELAAAGARELKLDVSTRIRNYRNERLPALLRTRLAKKWIPDQQVLRDYYKAHPEIGTVATRWHIGQVVVATRAEAERLRKAIVKGGSLFRIAGRYSIDPYGKAKNGDMGWLRAGSAFPDIEKAIARLKNGEVSPVIKTPRGYHIVTVIDRRQGRRMPFDAIADKVRQAYLDFKMTGYLNELQKKYKIVWKLLAKTDKGSNEKI